MQRGRSCTRPLHGFPTIPRRTSRRHSDSTYTCFNAYTHAENAQSTLANYSKSFLPRYPQGRRLLRGVVTFIMR